MANYPFLPQAKEHISPYELDYEMLLGLPAVRTRAKERVKACFDIAIHLSANRGDDDVEIASFPLAILYVSGVGDSKLLERFSLHEAQKVNMFLKSEMRTEIIIEIAKAFKWVVDYEQGKENTQTIIPFSKFLENTSRGRLVHDLKWKLVNRRVENGRVMVTPFELGRLLQEEVKYRIESLAHQKLSEVPQELQNDIDEIREAFIKIKPQLEEFDQIVRAQESEYPPCITGFMKRAAKGQHLSHAERFTLVTYLLRQGISVDSIVTLFSNVSDFNDKKTRYQVENLAGKTGGRTEPYMTYNCDTLQTHGVCLGPVDPICRTIRNPLSYHLRKQKQMPQAS